MSSVRLLRSAAPSLPKLASRATSRCTTPTPMLLAWVTPVCGRSPSCPGPSTFSWLRWPCLSSPRWSHSVGRESTPPQNWNVFNCCTYHFSFCVCLCSSSQRPLPAASAAHRPAGHTGPVLTVLAADPRLRLPVAPQHSALHAGVPGHVLCALHPRQHLPGKYT